MIKVATKNLYKKLKLVSGFTLIEILIVIFILGTVGTITTSIFVTALRGGNKSTTINDVRQNGNYIISQMSKMISYAQCFEGVSTDPSASSYSAVCAIPSPKYEYIKIKSFDNGETVFNCGSNTIASNGASLIDTNKMTIPNSSCYFYCARSSNSNSPTVNITFTLQSNGSLAENNSNIVFETSITPRNNCQSN